MINDLGKNDEKRPLLKPEGEPIPICISNGKAYIWTVEQIKRLRIDHQICGLLTGTLPQLAQQNVFLGLPLQLMPEEVVCLVELGIAILVDDINSHKLPNEEQSKQYKLQNDSKIKKEIQILIQRENQRKQIMKEVYKDKIQLANELRKKRQQQKHEHEQEQNNNSIIEQDDIMIETDQNPKDSEISTMIPYYIPIDLSTQSSSSYQPQHINNLIEAREIGLWTYPNDQYQKARCAVFSDLWRKGMFLGIGMKFGCDFLVYPGDSLRFHSHFACTVISDPEAPIEPLSLVSYGRLATAVKKSHLLACWDEETGRVEYMSLEWAGMG